MKNSNKNSLHQTTHHLDKGLPKCVLFTGICLAVLSLSACSSIAVDDSPEVAPRTTELDHSERDLTIWPTLDFSKTYDAEVEKKVAELLETMSLEQKIAQMIQPEIRDFTVEDMRRYGFGSYLNGGGAFPQNNKHAKPQDWIKLAEDMYQASIDDSQDGSNIPTIWGTDAVHGHNNVIGATLFPHNIGLGAANNPELIEEIAKATAREVMATGIDWVFAPTVAVVRNDRWGRTYEGYSEDPSIVKAYSAAIVKGLQGPVGGDFLGDSRVISTVKHFLGDGGTQEGIDQGNNVSDEQTLFDVHAQGYVGGLGAGAQSVMASFNSWHGQKIHGHEYLLTQVLKQKMGFDGFVVGDWLGHGQVKGCTNYSCAASINAGLDIFMASGDSWKPLMKNTIKQVKNGEISEERINDAVGRILRVKIRAGLFDKPSPARRPLAGRLDIIGSAAHRDVARRAVRESLVLLKNQNDILPIKPTANVLVAGDAADNIGKQSGGWTITWQGTNNTNADFPGGHSIYDGIAKALTTAGGQATLSIEGNYDVKPDVAIVVFGEEPYAEGVGDIKHLAYQSGDKSDLALLQRLKADGIPVVAIFISGRPLYVNAELNASDAFVAAWLPGSEGQGISDVLIANENGDPNYDFVGRLPYSWPASPHQTEVNVGDDEYAPLLPFGYGLSYSQANPTDFRLSGNLSVETVEDDTLQNQVFFKKSAVKPLIETLESKATQLKITSNTAELDGLSVRTIDKTVQEDARQLDFTQDTNTNYSLYSTEPIDLGSALDQGLSLFINLRIDTEAKGDVDIGMSCGPTCGGFVGIKHQLVKLPTNVWQEINISLNCLKKAGLDLSRVQKPFIMKSAESLTISISEVSLKNTPNVESCN